MFNRPTLPPLNYLLWRPEAGTYVREAPQFIRQIASTINRNSALHLPEEQALRVARQLIRRTGQVIELRPVHQPIAATAQGAA